MSKTRIEWADSVWNPVTGCDPVSRGCDNCYAKRMSKRLAGRFGYHKKFPFNVTLHPNRLDEPIHWNKNRRVFVCSMGDLFHEDVPFRFQCAVFARMNVDSTFIVLTKRPRIMREFIDRVHDNLKFTELSWPPENVWFGVSAEDQDALNKRVTELLLIKSVKRVVSIEPMLELVDLKNILDANSMVKIDALNGLAGWPSPHAEIDDCKIHWVIAGAETGPGARKADLDWFRSLRDQCCSANVPFYLKQIVDYGGKISMPELDGKVWAEVQPSLKASSK